MSKPLSKADRERLTREAEYMDKCLGRLRQWHAGFAAAGGKAANDVDALRRSQLLIADLMRGLQ